MKSIALAMIMIVAFSLHGCSQSSASKKENAGSQVVVGGECEGCEATHESPVPFEKLLSSLTLPDFKDAGPRLKSVAPSTNGMAVRRRQGWCCMYTIQI